MLLFLYPFFKPKILNQFIEPVSTYIHQISQLNELGAADLLPAVGFKGESDKTGTKGILR